MYMIAFIACRARISILCGNWQYRQH